MTENREPYSGKRVADQEGTGGVEAIIMNKEEQRLWEEMSSILDEPISVCVRLCALSGAEHYLAELGQMEQAALAGALLRLHAERRGIEVRAHEPSTREVKMGRKDRRGKRKPP